MELNTHNIAVLEYLDKRSKGLKDSRDIEFSILKVVPGYSSARLGMMFQEGLVGRDGVNRSRVKDGSDYFPPDGIESSFFYWIMDAGCVAIEEYYRAEKITATKERKERFRFWFPIAVSFIMGAIS